MEREQLNDQIRHLQEAYGPSIFKLFRRFDVSGHDADEAWQNLWQKVSRHLNRRGMPQVSEGGWLMKSALRIALDYRKKRGRDRQRQQEVIERKRRGETKRRKGVGEFGSLCTPAKLLGELNRIAALKALRTIIDALPLSQKVVVERHFYEDCEIAEIVGDLGISRTAVIRRLDRALKRIEKEMRNLGYDAIS